MKCESILCDNVNKPTQLCDEPAFATSKRSYHFLRELFLQRQKGKAVGAMKYEFIVSATNSTDLHSNNVNFSIKVCLF